MNYSKILIYGLLSMLLAFTSCKKEEVSEMNEEIEETAVDTTTTNPLVLQMSYNISSTTGLDLECFSVDFPFDLDVAGSIVTINDNDDFEAVLLDEPEIIDFVYPLAITYPDGETESIADAEALGNAFASCIPDGGWVEIEGTFPAFLINDLNSCYTLSYPVSLVDAEGNVSVANDEGEFIDLASTNNTLSFQFPLSLIDEDGNVATAEDDEGLFQLLFECEDDVYNPGGEDPFFYDCWDYTFPFNMMDQDGNTVSINNHNDFFNALLNGTALEYVYPLTLTNSDGELLVVNNETELSAAWIDCGVIIISETDLVLISFIFQSDVSDPMSCYSINYPLTYTNAETGETNTIDDAAAAVAYVDQGSASPFEIVDFPVTVTEVATGNQVTFEDLEAYMQYLTDCF